MIVYIPDSFLPERRYIIDCLLGEFLGLDFEMRITGDPDHYRIIVTEGKELLIKDAFFSMFNEPDGYLRRSNIPDKVERIKESFIGFYDVPVLFGEKGIYESENKLICNADFFASAFFMLTRWEEYVTQERDFHNRFPGYMALSVRHNFHDRPVVDEYTEIIWSLLCRAGYKGKRKSREYKIVPTHDVDRLIYWDRKTRKSVLKNISGDLFIRRNPAIAMRRGLSFCRFILTNSNDPCLRFEYFMNLAEMRGIKANFYFISGHQSSYDPEIYVNTSLFKNIISKIKERNHIIGIHPSYNSYINPSLLSSELKELKTASNIEIWSGRQHYLRFESPLTWKLLDECQLKRDSSMYFSGYPGFRCGTCHEFPVFDIIERKALKLKEMPLLLMDTCLYKLKHDKAAETIRKIKAEVKKFNGEFVFLWHNCMNLNVQSQEYNRVFEEEFYE